MKRLFILLPLIVSYQFLLGQQSFKKIEIVESDNPILNKRIYNTVSVSPEKSEEYMKLKDYAMMESNVTANISTESAFFFDMMNWVSNQWEHNGWKTGDSLSSYEILQNAKNGEKYRCVEYARVLNDVLLACGHTSRVVSLKNSNSAYGGAEMGHVAVEAWSNELKKWIFLDPQFNVYLTYNGIALNIYEIFKAREGGYLQEVKVRSGNATKNISKDGYLDFLTNYLGYISIRQTDDSLQYELALMLEGKNEYLTFQSLPWGKTVFTDNYKELYYNINQTMIIIDFTKEEYERTSNELKKCVIKSVEDFNNNMPLFAAKPKLTLSFDNNMIDFEKYEVTFNEQTLTVKNKLDIVLETGVNSITATCINKSGVRGVPTNIRIKYE
ncbi:hypothetical protein PbJCM13498_03890 [Prolixibacter bellariivorans]|uniref:Transglutaminase-like domain-containing protein n=1 Tax=Prolixibacter bellariivorans TaxID=314319 RepID=A0A5M4AVC2_9BACT|nr:transglutaminase-like domain-containing protein [Prolixibacter bellariivorans]GET31526.1 hypothetical protein PbJCM13498_03890 [Prolixibacter bellariivorans]